MPNLSMESDNFRNRGAVEQEAPGQQGNTNLRGQLGHRNKGPIIDSHDSDFPEPGENPEHTGEPVMTEQEPDTERNISPENENDTENRDRVEQDPGMRQKANQNEEKDDPLAA